MENKDIIGIFDDEHSLVAAMEALKERGVPMKDTYTPYPVHHTFEILERRSRFTLAAFFYGLLAVIGILGFVMYTSVHDWPLIFGGKPTSAFPSFIVVAVVITILSITILSLFTFSIRARIYPGKTGRSPGLGETDDKFLLVLERSSLHDEASVRELLSAKGASSIVMQDSI